MHKTCLTCLSWRITERDRAGRLKIIEIAKHKYGYCLSENKEWHYKPYRHHCHKWQQASEVSIKRRSKELNIGYPNEKTEAADSEMQGMRSTI